MPLILNIETATSVCSVALAEDGALLSLREENKGYTHAENITLFIEQVLKESGRKISELEAVAVSSGPGSYTGLRIGASTAKGLCYALGKPLMALSTLQSLANTLLRTGHSITDSLLCPMLDARRMEVYCGIYDGNLHEREKVSAKIIDENSFAEQLKENKIIFLGDGAEKCKDVLSHRPNAVFISNIFPSAASMTALAEEKFRRKEFEDVALFEPFYLKEFAGALPADNGRK